MYPSLPYILWVPASKADPITAMDHTLHMLSVTSNPVAPLRNQKPSFTDCKQLFLQVIFIITLRKILT
jgi:hypothetical protein